MINSLSFERQEEKIHQKFLNFGGRVNLGYDISERFGMFLNFGVLYTPYEVRGTKFQYHLNNESIKRAQSNTNILNWTVGIGFRYKFKLK